MTCIALSASFVSEVDHPIEVFVQLLGSIVTAQLDLAAPWWTVTTFRMLTTGAASTAEFRIVLIPTKMTDPPPMNGWSRAEPQCWLVVLATTVVAATVRRGHTGHDLRHSTMGDRCCRSRRAAQCTSADWWRNVCVFLAAGTHLVSALVAIDYTGTACCGCMQVRACLAHVALPFLWCLSGHDAFFSSRRRRRILDVLEEI